MLDTIVIVIATLASIAWLLRRRRELRENLGGADQATGDRSAGDRFGIAAASAASILLGVTFLLARALYRYLT